MKASRPCRSLSSSRAIRGGPRPLVSSVGMFAYTVVPGHGGTGALDTLLRRLAGRMFVGGLGWEQSLAIASHVD